MNFGNQAIRPDSFQDRLLGEAVDVCGVPAFRSPVAALECLLAALDAHQDSIPDVTIHLILERFAVEYADVALEGMDDVGIDDDYDIGSTMDVLDHMDNEDDDHDIEF